MTGGLHMRSLPVFLFLLLSSINATAREAVPFINDDFSQAITQAKGKKQPIFVEAWAPW
jgi:hypothetical protein